MLMAFIFFFSTKCWALDPGDINQVVDACVVQLKRDVICDFLFQVKEVGNDAVEAVKVFFKLTPRDYAILTAANMIATGRVRFQTKSFLHPEARHTFDFKKDSYLVTIELKF
ncbi:MAG: hypothetical protein HUU56_05385 [Bdellovibrionaceae bacterium]|nr:hypothetical protein [Pseudobdellovibrionaceae bacterium]